MIYPKFLKENDTIGISAPSAGVGYKLEDFQKSVDKLMERGFKIVETASVRNLGDVSASGEVRATELISLFENENVDAVFCASGGDFLMEMLPFVDIEKIGENPKWFMGYSDPTSLLYWTTTHLDMATFYGFNAGSFDMDKWHESLETAYDFWKGNWHVQNSFSMWQKEKSKGEFVLDTLVEWESLTAAKEARGRVIGGCIDVLRDLIGTKRDCTREFLERYPEDKFIWYFDVFSLTADDFYRVLFQMNEAGWFERVAGVVVGRVLFEGGFTEMTYKQALKNIFGEDVLLVFNADIGHTAPHMMMVNGAVALVKAEDKKGSIEFFQE